MTVDDVIAKLRYSGNPGQLPAPYYNPKPHSEGIDVAFVTPSMQQHMTDEGWQIMDGLAYNGYKMCAEGCYFNTYNVSKVTSAVNVRTAFIQDKREWDNKIHNSKYKGELFTNLEAFADPNIFKVTILKDSHQRPFYHSESCRELCIHAWVVYYNPKIVAHLARYVRPQHLIRTYHTIDKNIIPPFNIDRSNKALVSGALSKAYPLRTRIFKLANSVNKIQPLKHPGYHVNGSDTPSYLKTLNKYKVAICTCSMYGYALRKIIEATACGCTVITNLPEDEVLPHIDSNLVRIDPNESDKNIVDIVQHTIDNYDYQKQYDLSLLAQDNYDFRVVTSKLALDIEELRLGYKQ